MVVLSVSEDRELHHDSLVVAGTSFGDLLNVLRRR